MFRAWNNGDDFHHQIIWLRECIFVDPLRPGHIPPDSVNRCPTIIQICEIKLSGGESPLHGYAQTFHLIEQRTSPITMERTINAYERRRMDWTFCSPSGIRFHYPRWRVTVPYPFKHSFSDPTEGGSAEKEIFTCKAERESETCVCSCRAKPSSGSSSSSGEIIGNFTFLMTF